MDMDLNHLTEAERDAILSVLSKDEDLRKKEYNRIKTLKAEVQKLKMKGVIRPGQDAEKTCARCRQSFGWIFNKGQPCPLCHHKVCEKCREIVGGPKWLCVLCYKQKELEVMSGNWFHSKFRKSKRNKKTNQVITGPELVRASIKTRPVVEQGSTAVAEEVKRALSNNNSSPKSQRSPSPPEESSDTQSLADATSPRRSKRVHDSDEAAFPQETDRALLLELIRPKRSNGPIPENRVDIKRVSSARYKDSDSSSGSETSSPQMSSRQDSAFTHSDSLRSSMRSQASSIPSSEGRMTIVTDTASHLDYPTADTQSWLEPSPRPSRRTQPQSHYGATPNPALDTAAGTYTVTVSKDPDASSGEEYDEEQITKIKFKRVSIKRNANRSRSPSPEPGSHGASHLESSTSTDVRSLRVRPKGRETMGEERGKPLGNHSPPPYGKHAQGGGQIPDLALLHGQSKHSANTKLSSTSLHGVSVTSNNPVKPPRLGNSNSSMHESLVLDKRDENRSVGSYSAFDTPKSPSLSQSIGNKGSAWLSEYGSSGRVGSDTESSRLSSRGNTPSPSFANRKADGREVHFAVNDGRGYYGVDWEDSSSEGHLGGAEDSSFDEISDYANSSYEDLEESAFYNYKLGDHSSLMEELRAALVTGLSDENLNNNLRPDTQSSQDYASVNMEGDILDEEEGEQITYRTAMAKVLRQAAPVSEEEDSLSVISEKTEPGEEEGGESTSTIEGLDEESEGVSTVVHADTMHRPSAASRQTATHKTYVRNPPKTERSENQRRTVQNSVTSASSDSLDGPDSKYPKLDSSAGVSKTAILHTSQAKQGVSPPSDLPKAEPAGAETFSDKPKPTLAPLKRQDTFDRLVEEETKAVPVSDLDDDIEVILQKNKKFFTEEELSDIIEDKFFPESDQYIWLDPSHSSGPQVIRILSEKHAVTPPVDRPHSDYPNQGGSIPNQYDLLRPNTAGEVQLPREQIGSDNENVDDSPSVGVSALSKLFNVKFTRGGFEQSSSEHLDHSDIKIPRRRLIDSPLIFNNEPDSPSDAPVKEPPSKLPRIAITIAPSETLENSQHEEIVCSEAHQEHSGNDKRRHVAQKPERHTERKEMKEMKTTYETIGIQAEANGLTSGVAIGKSPATDERQADSTATIVNVQEVTEHRHVISTPVINAKSDRNSQISGMVQSNNAPGDNLIHPGPSSELHKEFSSKSPPVNSQKGRLFTADNNQQSPNCDLPSDPKIIESASPTGEPSLDIWAVSNSDVHHSKTIVAERAENVGTSSAQINTDPGLCITASQESNEIVENKPKIITKHDPKSKDEPTLLATTMPSSLSSSFPIDSQSTVTGVYEHEPEPKLSRHITDGEDQSMIDVKERTVISKVETSPPVKPIRAKHRAPYAVMVDTSSVCSENRGSHFDEEIVKECTVSTEEISSTMNIPKMPGTITSPPSGMSEKDGFDIDKENLSDTEQLFPSQMSATVPSIAEESKGQSPQTGGAVELTGRPLPAEGSDSPGQVSTKIDSEEAQLQQTKLEAKGAGHMSQELATGDTGEKYASVKHSSSSEDDMLNRSPVHESEIVEGDGSPDSESGNRLVVVSRRLSSSYEKVYDEIQVDREDEELALSPNAYNFVRGLREEPDVDMQRTPADFLAPVDLLLRHPVTSSVHSDDSDYDADNDMTAASVGSVSEHNSQGEDQPVAHFSRTDRIKLDVHTDRKREGVILDEDDIDIGPQTPSRSPSCLSSESEQELDEISDMISDISVGELENVDTDKTAVLESTTLDESSTLQDMSIGNESYVIKDISNNESTLSADGESSFSKAFSSDSLDVLLDEDSDAAIERAHPEKLEEDFTLSLDLGPRPDPWGLDRAERVKQGKLPKETREMEAVNLVSRPVQPDLTQDGLKQQSPTISHPSDVPVETVAPPQSSTSSSPTVQNSMSSISSVSTCIQEYQSSSIKAEIDSHDLTPVATLRQHESPAQGAGIGSHDITPVATLRQHESPAQGAGIDSHDITPVATLRQHESPAQGAGIGSHDITPVATLRQHESPAQGACIDSHDLTPVATLRQHESPSQLTNPPSDERLLTNQTANKHQVDNSKLVVRDKTNNLRRKVHVYDDEEWDLSDLSAFKDNEGQTNPSVAAPSLSPPLSIPDQAYSDPDLYIDKFTYAEHDCGSPSLPDATEPVSQANGFLAPPVEGTESQESDSPTKDDTPDGATGANPDEDKSCHSIPSSPVPSISVTSPLAAETQSTGSKSGEEKDENIDELFASHSGSPYVNRADSTTSSQRSGNMLSPFSRRKKAEALSAASKESIMSFYSDAGEVNYGKIPVTGDILFGLDYNYKQGIFEILVKQCKDIAPVDTKKKRSDPYVKTYLLPDRTKNGKRKTRRKKNTLSPTFEEKLTYKINKSELETRTLWVTVWHNDTFGRNDFLGEVTIPLDYYKFGDPTPLWYKLEERKKRGVVAMNKTGGSPLNNSTHTEIKPEPISENKVEEATSDSSIVAKIKPEKLSSSKDGGLPYENSPISENPVGGMTMLAYKGELIVSLKFVANQHLPGGKKKSKGGANRGELHVLVKKARNLTAIRSNGGSDPFCKVYLLPERSRNTKQKTHVVKHNCNPEWNHTFTFEDVSWDDLKEKCLELSVWDYDRFSSNDFLGGVRLGCGTGNCAGKAVDWMDSKGEEISVWQNMLDRPNYWIDGTVPLRAKLA